MQIFFGLYCQIVVSLESYDLHHSSLDKAFTYIKLITIELQNLTVENQELNLRAKYVK